jgi:hypothetical protein
LKTPGDVEQFTICLSAATSGGRGRACLIQQFWISLQNPLPARYRAPTPARGMSVVINPRTRSHPMATLTSPLFWSMKIKITILTLATFAALC